MPRYELYMWLLKGTWLAFIVALGCCIGSLINVLVYRMPRGLSVVSPPSRCPSCGTRLTWRENIPVLGWLLLRGRCRFCQAKISPEYPIVEASIGVLFGVFYALWFIVPDQAVWLGVNWGAIKPEWAGYPNQAEHAWPAFAVLLVLLGALAAMTLVDARTFTIPLELTIVPAVAALLVHPVHAAWVGGLRRAAEGWDWTIPTPGEGPGGWRLIGMSVGGVLGLVLANVLLAKGLLRRSFADYEQWASSVEGKDPAAPSVPPPLERDIAIEAPVTPEAPPPAPDQPADMWIRYPHARREMVVELLFLAPCLGLAMAGWHAPDWLGFGGTPVPLWLRVLGGVLLGYLVGGGVVWGVRIFGSLGFGKEAMGLGDVHLMAAVGACLGWIDAVLAFFGAAFVGLAWTIAAMLLSGRVRRAMPYGPFLAISTVLVLLAKPAIEVALSRLLSMGQPIDIP